MDESYTLKTKSSLIKVGFINMMLIEILQIIVNSLNNFIDSIITGQLLGTGTLAAVGFFQPMLTIISLEWVIIMGVQILCSKYIGRNEEDDGEKVISLFVGSVIFLGAGAVIFSAVCFIGSEKLAEILGAAGSTAVLLSDYIQGYSFGIIGQVLYPLLLWGLSFLKGNIKLSAVTIFIMMATNIAMDLLLILQFDAGAFGLGLATSISYLVTAIFIFAHFSGGDENSNVQWSFKNLNFIQLIKSARYGLPALMFNVGVTIKAYLMNITLMNSVGDAAVATMAVQGNICGILGAIPLGCANAYVVLGSMYYGSEDRFSVKNISEVALKYCVLLSGGAMILLMSASNLIPAIFFKPNEEAFFVAQRMLILFPSFLIFNGLMGILLKACQFQKKDEQLINMMAIIENLLMAAISVAFTPLIGSDAVWLSFPAADLICIAIIAVTVFKSAGGITFKLVDWLKLDKNFGSNERKFLECSFNTIESAVNASENTINFCLESGIDTKRSNFAGIIVEELTANIVSRGVKNYNAYVRVHLGDKITIHVCDDTPKFNPLEILKKAVNAPEENLEFRLIQSISQRFNCKGIEHRYTAGTNNIIVKL